MHEVSVEDWKKLNIRVGQVKAAQKHPSHHHYLLLIDLGPVEQDMTIVADLQEGYELDQLIGKQVAFILNFEHKVVEGVESQGLLLTTHKDKKPVLLVPDTPVSPGVHIHGHNEEDYVYEYKPGEHTPHSV